MFTYKKKKNKLTSSCLQTFCILSNHCLKMGSNRRTCQCQIVSFLCSYKSYSGSYQKAGVESEQILENLNREEEEKVQVVGFNISLSFSYTVKYLIKLSYTIECIHCQEGLYLRKKKQTNPSAWQKKKTQQEKKHMHTDCIIKKKSLN